MNQINPVLLLATLTQQIVEQEKELAEQKDSAEHSSVKASLSANLLKQLGIPGGLITKYHQSADPTDTDQAYLDNLEVLEYDVLYGDKSAYEGENPYPVIDMTMGCEPIEISSVSRRYGRVLVNGANFTECSVIELDGESYPTAFINSAQIVAIVPRTTEVHQVCIVQKSADGVEMGRTEPYSLDD